MGDLPRQYHRKARTIKRNASWLTRQNGKEQLLRRSEMSKDHYGGGKWSNVSVEQFCNYSLGLYEALQTLTGDASDLSINSTEKTKVRWNASYQSIEL